MASYKDIFSTFYDALTADVDRGRIADFCEEMLQKYHQISFFYIFIIVFSSNFWHFY